MYSEDSILNNRGIKALITRRRYFDVNQYWLNNHLSDAIPIHIVSVILQSNSHKPKLTNDKKENC